MMYNTVRSRTLDGIKFGLLSIIQVLPASKGIVNNFPGPNGDTPGAGPVLDRVSLASSWSTPPAVSCKKPELHTVLLSRRFGCYSNHSDCDSVGF